MREHVLLEEHLSESQKYLSLSRSYVI
jgi:hypothetical protein